MRFILPDTQENMDMLRSLVQFERLLRRITGVRTEGGDIVFRAVPYNKGVSNKKLRQIVQAKPFRAEMPSDGERFQIRASQR
jgi:hypothetical protein